MNITKQIILGIFLTLILAFSVFITWVYSRIDSSLPQLDGQKSIYGLSASVTVNRDKQGIPTIIAKDRIDLAVATGFIHAQERFFQMDLLRRNSAGELSSLFGQIALDYDTEIRQHRFRERAQSIFNNLPDVQKTILKAYTQGVNEGLNHLYAKPFEYYLLQQEPVEWQEVDTILTVLSMYIDLQYSDGERERTLGLLQSTLSKQAYHFLNPMGSQWDAAIDHTEFSASPLPSMPWPSASASLANISAETKVNSTSIKDRHYSPGSNNWAVSGNISQTGSAIVANDMHLGIRVPNTWFRASFEYQQDDMPIKVTGATLPGTPIVVVGSNGHIAWGFTNSYGDWSDVITLETNEDGSQYLTPDGFEPFIPREQIIAVKGAPSVKITTYDTRWGPVIGTDHQGNKMAYRWVAHDLNAVNLTHMQLETTQGVDEAIEIAAMAGIPSQNFMVGDKQGNIGWTIMGPMPKKTDGLGEVPTSWADGSNGWLGYYEPSEYPKLINPAQDRLWTANSRVIGGEMYDKIGNGGYALGARAQQIKKRLFAKEQFNEQALLAIALDDEAIFLTRWQKILLEQVLTPENLKKHPKWQQALEFVKQKPLFASVDSVGYRLVSQFRIETRALVFEPLETQLSQLDENFSLHSIRHQLETPLWQLVSEQPDNYLLKQQESWQALLELALTNTISELTDGQPLSSATWGQENTSNIKHPLSAAVPLLGNWLDMPNTPLAGDTYMPRVQGKAFGASERMVVSPGYESQGIFHMPTSQSGHPWSPYYRIGHEDWEQGKPSPFLPGETQYTLTLHSY
ncbi:penicillin acylase family protein [Thalassotalea fusca]